MGQFVAIGPTNQSGWLDFKMVILYISILLFSQVGTSISQDDEEDIAFCPPTHPYAFNNGESCCEVEVNMFDYDPGDQFCEGDGGEDGVVCPSPLGCDNFFPVCNGYGSVFGQGFDDENYNVEFKPLKDELEGEEVPLQLAHRVIFGEKDFTNENARKCIYWEEGQNRWRLGQCIAIGKDFPFIGYTLSLKNPKDCAVDNDGWLKASTNSIVEGGSLVGTVTFSSGASDVQSQTATASLTFVKTNSGSFKPKCKWRFRRGKFRCVKPRKRGKGKKKKKNNA